MSGVGCVVFHGVDDVRAITGFVLDFNQLTRYYIYCGCIQFIVMNGHIFTKFNKGWYFFDHPWC